MKVFNINLKYSYEHIHESLGISVNDGNMTLKFRRHTLVNNKTALYLNLENNLNTIKYSRAATELEKKK